MNYGFIIDNRKCIGCHACTVACKAEHDVPVGVNRTWVKYIEKGEFPNTRRLFSVMRCNHCQAAPCVEICPVSALYIRNDGIVDFDNRRCIGCKACMQACPYDALYIDPETATAAKCNYCSHRIDIGLEPACVILCPEQAIICGDIESPDSEISRLMATNPLTVRKIEKGTNPNLFYINGDTASLTPANDGQSPNYLWSSQATGVGHFAKQAESLIARNDPVQKAQILASQNKSDLVTYNQSTKGNENSIGRSEMGQKPKRQNALSKITNRVYDAPHKGMLWGWEVSAYIWTKAIAVGAFLVPNLASVLNLVSIPEAVQWFGACIAFLFLILTTGLLVIDLDKPTRFFYVLLRPQWKSWLVKGGYAIAAYGGFLVLWGHAKYWNLVGWEYFATTGGIILAIITAIYTAFLLAQAKGRDFWQSSSLSLHMLTHAIMAGAAVFAIFIIFFNYSASWNGFIGLVLKGSIAINLILLLLEMVTPHPTEDAQKTVQIIISGWYRNLFWLGVLVAGNFLPLVLILSGGAALMPLAGILVLTGIYVTEHIWILAPQRIPFS